MHPSSSQDFQSITLSSADWQTLHSFLQEDKIITQNLLDILNSERELLTARNYEALSTALTDKSLLVNQLEKRSAERQTFLKAAGFDSEKSLLAVAERDHPDIARTWNELAALWENCQHENQVNDQIVRRTRIVVQRVLDILHGQPDLGKTYNPRGESNNGYSSKAITSA
jgi:flagellar biosynthesis/type III secretory pathway chaperone